MLSTGCRLALLVSTSLSALALAASAQSPCEQWKPGFEVPGVLGIVKDVITFDDGAGPALYAAGRFELAGDARAAALAKWDGSRWHAVPGAPFYGEAFDLLVFDDGSAYGPVGTQNQN